MASYYPVTSASNKSAPGRRLLTLSAAATLRLGRLLGTISLGLIVLLNPGLGGAHQTVGWLIMLAIAPLGIIIDLWVAPRIRRPVQTAFDLSCVAFTAAMLPTAWFAALVVGALITGCSTPRFALRYKTLFFLLPGAFVGAMGWVANYYSLADTSFPLLAMALSVPFCLLHALQKQNRDEEFHGRMQLMAGLTRMAGGISHDFNNILTGIQGNAELAEQKLDRNHVARPYLRALLAESQKAQLFSAQLLAFSGGGVSGRERLDVNAELNGIVGLLESALPRRVALQIRTESDLPLVSANRAELQEILVACILHVADSIDHLPGKVRVALRTVTRRQGEELVLQIRSGGAEHKHSGERRSANRAALASLRFNVSAAAQIMEEHDGSIDVHGDWRSGMVISLRLPGLADTRSQPVRPSAPAALVARHVLLVEAKPAVRQVTHNLLQQLGHSVTSARSSKAALQAVGRDSTIEAILIGGSAHRPMDGIREMLDQVSLLRPDIKVLLSDGGGVAANTQPGGVAALAKPYSSTSLAAAIRRAFEG